MKHLLSCPFPDLGAAANLSIARLGPAVTRTATHGALCNQPNQPTSAIEHLSSPHLISPWGVRPTMLFFLLHRMSGGDFLSLLSFKDHDGGRSEEWSRGLLYYWFLFRFCET